MSLGARSDPKLEQIRAPALGKRELAQVEKYDYPQKLAAWQKFFWEMGLVRKQSQIQDRNRSLHRPDAGRPWGPGVIHPSLFQLCVCGHQKRDHIFNMDSCIPGYMCENGCKTFIANAPRIVTDKEVQAIVDWDPDLHDGVGPRSATEVTELYPLPFSNEVLGKIMGLDTPSDDQVRDRMERAQQDWRDGIPKINVCDHIEMAALIREFVRENDEWEGTVVCRNCGLNMRRGDLDA